MKLKIVKIGLLALGISSQLFAQNKWAPVGNGVSDTVGYYSSYSPIIFMVADTTNKNLYMGGTFQKAGTTQVWEFAKYNGSAYSGWSKTSGGITYYGCNKPPLTAYVKSPNEIYLGGFFTAMVGDDMNYVTKWNGTLWAAMGQAVDGNINAITEYNGQIYAGGWFTKNLDTGLDCFGMVRWNGTAWEQVGSANPVSGVPMAMIVFNNKLYVATDQGFIYTWDGSGWTQIASCGNTISSFAIYKNELYAAGNFTQMNNTSANNIAKLSGSSWVAVGTGTDNYINSLCSYRGKLYAGGKFFNAGGNAAIGIASWNGTSWSVVGGGAYGEVNGVAGMGNYLYIGGNFNSVEGGSVKACHFAKYSLTTNNTGMANYENAIAKLSVYPNPFSQQAEILIPLKFQGGSLEVINILGEVVKTIPVEATTDKIVLNKETLNNGVYFINLVRQGTIVANQKFIIQ